MLKQKKWLSSLITLQNISRDYTHSWVRLSEMNHGWTAPPCRQTETLQPLQPLVCPVTWFWSPDTEALPTTVDGFSRLKQFNLIINVFFGLCTSFTCLFRRQRHRVNRLNGLNGVKKEGKVLPGCLIANWLRRRLRNDADGGFSVLKTDSALI